MTAKLELSIPPALPPQCEWEPASHHYRQKKFSRLIYSYSRVSTNDQHINGLSLGEQKHQAEAYVGWLKTTVNDVLRERLEKVGMRADAARDFAAFAKYEYAGHYVEDPASARKISFRERPVGNVLCDRLRPGDTVIFTKFNRAFRNVADFQETYKWFCRGAVTMHFLDLRVDMSNPGVAELLLNIMAAVSEFEARNISDQTKAGLNAKRRRGDAMGNIRVGMGRLYWVDKSDGQKRSKDFYIREDVPVFRWVAWMRRVHGMSHTKIADRLEALLAARDGREPLSEGGVSVAYETRNAKEQGRVCRTLFCPVKNGMVSRPWSTDAVKKAAILWEEICADEQLRRKWPVHSKARKLLVTQTGPVGSKKQKAIPGKWKKTG